MKYNIIINLNKGKKLPFIDETGKTGILIKCYFGGKEAFSKTIAGISNPVWDQVLIIKDVTLIKKSDEDESPQEHSPPILFEVFKQDLYETE